MRVGFLMAFCSFACVGWFDIHKADADKSCRVLSGAPIAGELPGGEDWDWGGLINFCGITMLAGAALLLVSRLMVERRLLRVC